MQLDHNTDSNGIEYQQTFQVSVTSGCHCATWLIS